jgi:hypothetical protein
MVLRSAPTTDRGPRVNDPIELPELVAKRVRHLAFTQGIAGSSPAGLTQTSFEARFVIESHHTKLSISLP